MFNSISSVMDTVPQCLYQYQESSFLWSFGIFLSNMFTNIKSIFSYLFMFFKQSRDKDNTINQVIQEENIKLKEQVIQEENTKLKERVIQLENTNTKLKEQVIQLENTNTKLKEQVIQLENTNTNLEGQLSQSLKVNKDTKDVLTAYSESVDELTRKANESGQKTKELIALARFVSYLKLNRDLFIGIEYVLTPPNKRISLDYACLSITILTLKLSRLKEIDFAYANATKDKLVFKYECEIKLQKKYMREHNEPYSIDTLKSEYDGINNKFIDLVGQLIDKQKLLLEQYGRVELANDSLTEHMRKMPANKRSDFYTKYNITQQITNLNYLESSINALNEVISQLRIQHLDKLNKFNDYAMNILGLETVILTYTMKINNYKVLLKLDNLSLDKPAVSNKLKKKEDNLPGVRKQIAYTKQQIAQINDDLTASITKAHQLLEKCKEMCTTGETDIDNCKSIIKKQYGINITTDKGPQDKSMSASKNKGPATQKPKEIILKKKQSSLINVSEDVVNTAKPSSDLANMITDSTYTE
jgi:hypothetical protein